MEGGNSGGGGGRVKKGDGVEEEDGRQGQRWEQGWRRGFLFQTTILYRISIARREDEVNGVFLETALRTGTKFMDAISSSL